ILLDQGKGKLFIAYEGPIAALDPDGLTPRAAHALLYELARKAKSLA
ncbi:MAG: hypothetical protein HUK26_08135, partial [Duodenibacillus sp.]|nr:hypothetical protein [Duodenibacillus sp.]